MPLKPVKLGSRVELTDDIALDGRAPRGEEAEQQLEPLIRRLMELQVALYAEARQSLLVILQGRDASGKDGLTRKVFGPLNSQGCVVSNFKKPTQYELARDYLWRVHQVVPPRGTIGIFNRSHYEDVLVVRVHGLVPESVWSKRFGQINDFERMLSENGVTILKFFLHISREEQKQRLLERLHDPLKNWKFEVGDLDERKRWDDYTEPYEEVLEKCSTEWAPWYVVPSDRKSTRNLLVAQVVTETLERMKPEFPRVDPEVLKIARKWERETTAQHAIED
ncbi:MAG: polyphosphate kinase 2 family protein [Gemmatimonadales bacterium]|nr:MAG: polyphosphate kinase 2 family protein [Gemmatimonadales bacterium]